MSDIIRWSLHQVPATKAPKMLERRDGMWVLYEDHIKSVNLAIDEAVRAEREATLAAAEEVRDEHASGEGEVYIAEKILESIRNRKQEG